MFCCMDVQITINRVIQQISYVCILYENCMFVFSKVRFIIHDSCDFKETIIFYYAKQLNQAPHNFTNNYTPFTKNHTPFWNVMKQKKFDSWYFHFNSFFRSISKIWYLKNIWCDFHFQNICMIFAISLCYLYIYTKKSICFVLWVMIKLSFCNVLMFRSLIVVL